MKQPAQFEQKEQASVQWDINMEAEEVKSYSKPVEEKVSRNPRQ